MSPSDDPVRLTNPEDFLYSVVIPVFNSGQLVGDTITAVVEFFDAVGWNFELILVNDGSDDDSWNVLCQAADTDERIVVLNLLRNYGQHNANLAGLRQSKGDYVITMDDDLQNPPSEIEHLVNKAMEGHDVVFGKFDRKKAPFVRSIGTRLIGRMNRRIFGQPDDLVVSNHRILNREVVDRICNSRSAFPYITGQALMFSHHPANAEVRHDPRPIGKSNYNVFRITTLVMRILFSYSSAPLRIVGGIGAVMAAGSITIGVLVALRSVFTGAGVEGWTSTIVLLSFLNGIIIMMLAMLGEYLIRVLSQVSSVEPYYVRDSRNA